MDLRGPKRCGIGGLVLAAAAVAFAGNGRAENAAIGQAVLIERDVSGSRGGQTRRLSDGSGIFTNELIATQIASMARLTFLDTTNLALGPASQVRLDRFVFDPAHGARSVALRTAIGAFRFVTGDSDPRAFAITTPVATIGVRGTALDFRNRAGRTLVVLESGAAIVCVKAKPSRCVRLVPGTYAIASASRIEGPLSGSAPFRFADLCTAGSADICRFTKAAHAASDRTGRRPDGGDGRGPAEAHAGSANGGSGNGGSAVSSPGNSPSRGKTPGG
jgi:hypothetical protein